MNLEISHRVAERIINPLFKITKKHLEDLLSSFSDLHFAYVFEVANSNGEINFIGRINADYPRKMEEFYYETNITGPALAYLDVLVEMVKNRDWPGVHHNLHLREVESFLRESNDRPAFSADEVSHFRIHECLNGLESYLHNRFLLSDRKKSPTFNDSNIAIPTYNKEMRGPFFNSISHSEQLQVIDEIFDQYILESLERDGGGAEICHVGDQIISIRYTGNCNECSASLGSTLDYIQKTLRFNLQEHNLLVVTDS